MEIPASAGMTERAAGIAKKNTFLPMVLLMLIFFFVSIPVFAIDYGAVLSGNFLAEDLSEAGKTNRFTAILAPWFSMPIGEADFFVSIGVQTDYADYRDNDKLLFIPELYKLEFSTKPMDDLYVKAGRIFWQDSSHLVAKGYFDGANLLLDKGIIRIGASLFYTGLLYYDSAKINVSPKDQKALDYAAPFDWSNFSDTYFSPRRLLTSVYVEFPSFPYERGNLYAGLMAQFDLSDTDEKFHTQYLLVRHTMSYKEFDASVSGVAELENTKADGVRAAFATSVEGGWRLPSEIKDRLSLGVKWASGEGSSTAPFFPIVLEEQGLALKPYLTGMMTITAKYEVRLLPSLSAELRGHYFIRTDSETFIDSDIEYDSYTLGAELGGSLLFVPFSDLSFSLGCGFFLPQTGGAMRDDAPVRWSIGLGTILSF